MAMCTLDEPHSEKTSTRSETSAIIPYLAPQTASFSAHNKKNVPFRPLFNSRSPPRSSATTTYFSDTATPHFARQTASSSARRETILSSTPSHSPPRSSATTTYFSDTATPHFARQTASSSARRETISSSTPSHSPPRSISPSNITATNPRRIAQLWKTVMARGSNLSIPTRPSTSNSATTTKTGATEKESTISKASVTDPDFYESILEPHGMLLKENGPNPALLPDNSFPGLPDDRLEYYRKAYQLKKIWNRADFDDVSEQYMAMSLFRCPEATYRHFALSEIFHSEPLKVELPDNTVAWDPIRNEEVCQKAADHLEKPPRLSTDEERKIYGWEFHPDTCYGFSRNALPDGIRGNAKQYVSVMMCDMICPYMSIEFKRENSSVTAPTRTAKNQLAVAALMTLYNRWNLKRKAIKAEERQWSEGDKKALRYYGITFLASEWALWCFTLNDYENWRGITMQLVEGNSCVEDYGVRRLYEITSDLHYWGLELHAHSCVKDLKAIMPDPSKKAKETPDEKIPGAHPDEEVPMDGMGALHIDERRRQTIA